MSVNLGAELPQELLAHLQGADGGSWADQAVLLATVDDTGRPHAALLSFDELFAPDKARLRLACYADSTTTSNLRARGAATLCFVVPGSVHYVKTRTSELLGHGEPRQACFEASVEQVLRDDTRADLEGAAEIVSGITFRRTQNEPPLRQRLRAL